MIPDDIKIVIGDTVIDKEYIEDVTMCSLSELGLADVLDICLTALQDIGIQDQVRFDLRLFELED